MAIGLGITFYYLVADIPPISERNLVTDNIGTLPISVSITIFAIEAIGVVSCQNYLRKIGLYIYCFCRSCLWKTTWKLRKVSPDSAAY